MFLPLKTESNDETLVRWPVANLALIALTVVVSMFLLRHEQLLRSSLLWRSGGHLPQLVSHAFAHGGIGHLIGNMIFLLAFGNALNRRVGHLNYVGLYLLVAGLGGLGWLMFGHGTAALGASAAAMGIAGAALVLLPFAQVTVAVWLLLFVLVVVALVTAIPVGIAAALGGQGAATLINLILLTTMAGWWSLMLMRPWDQLSPAERFGRLLGYVSFKLSAVWVVAALVGLDLLALGSADGVGHTAHVAGAAGGIVIALFANAIGYVRGSDAEPTLPEWAGLVEHTSGAATTSGGKPRIVIQGGFAS